MSSFLFILLGSASGHSLARPMATRYRKKRAPEGALLNNFCYGQDDRYVDERQEPESTGPT